MTEAIRLSRILKDIATVSIEQDLPITGLTLDSRQVTPGDLFLALKGGSVDGAAYIAQAQKNGAVAAIVEHSGDINTGEQVTIPVLNIAGLRRHVGLIAERFYQFPSRELCLVGITGTNGKTSCSYFLAQSLQYLKKACAVIGTTGYGPLDKMQTATHTTPDAIRIRQLLRQFRRQGLDHVAMEVSSHALEQHRVADLQFDIAVFTNLSRDHLDYHGSMDNYAKTKAQLFSWPGLRCAAINFDDAFGLEIAKRTEHAVVGYSLQSEVKSRTERWVFGEILETNKKGFRIRIHSHLGEAETQIYLLGLFNLSNVMAVAAVLIALDYKIDEIAGALCQCRPVPGRMERFGGEGVLPLVIVDYAHTPDALEKALAALKSHLASNGRLYVVFGCGGDRDQGKRALMGEAAEKWAQKIIITDDNPRSEPSEKILQQILQGIKLKERVLVESDRGRAIRHALTEATAEDVVLIAGKGHEEFQWVGQERRPFSDRHEVEKVLQELAA